VRARIDSLASIDYPMTDIAQLQPNA